MCLFSYFFNTDTPVSIKLFLLYSLDIKYASTVMTLHQIILPPFSFRTLSDIREPLGNALFTFVFSVFTCVFSEVSNKYTVC